MGSKTKIKRVDGKSVTYYDEGEKEFGIIKEFKDEPLVFLSRLAKLDDDLVEFKAAGLPFVLVNDPEIVHQSYVRMHGAFTKSNRANRILNFSFGNGILSNPSVESHRTHRKIIMPGFQRTQLEVFARKINELVCDRFSRIKASSNHDISQDMFQITLGIINKALFNFDIEEEDGASERIGEAVQVMQKGIYKKFNQLLPRPPWLLTPTNVKLQNAKDRVGSIIQQLIDERLDSEQENDRHRDMLDIMLEATYENGDVLEHSQIIDELITLVFAGHETTSNSMIWTFYLLCQHPEVVNKLRKEIDSVDMEHMNYQSTKDLAYTEQVIKESMRLYPPVWCLGARTSRETSTIGNYIIPKGVEMLVCPYTLHRNERVFPDAERFDPSRFEPEAEKKIPRGGYAPFGLGPRMCIGNHFAMMEAKIILANFIKMFDFSLHNDQKLKLMPELTMYNETGMHLKIAKRRASKAHTVKDKSKLVTA